MLDANAIRLWDRLHRWTSLICTVFLLVLCVTGLPLIFKDAIEAFFTGEFVPSTAKASSQPASLDRVTEAAIRRYPGQVPLSFYWDEHAAGIIRFSVGKKPNVPWKDAQWIAIDERTAQVVENVPSEPFAMEVVLKLHKELLAGLPGELLLCFMGLTFLLSLVSGVILYGPFMRKLDFGAVPRDRSTRVKWLDLHNLTGISTVAWAMVVGATGVVNTLSTPLFDKWQSDEMPKWLAPYHDKQPPIQISSVEAAVGSAQIALPSAIVWSVVFPYAQGGSPRHYLIWTHGNSAVTSRLFTPVLIDAATGELLAAHSLPWYLKTLELSRPLHFGDYGGTPMKIIWALLDIVTITMLASGLYLWIKRRHLSIEEQLRQDAVIEAPMREEKE